MTDKSVFPVFLGVPGGRGTWRPGEALGTGRGGGEVAARNQGVWDCPSPGGFARDRGQIEAFPWIHSYMECSCDTTEVLGDLWKGSHDLWRLKKTSAHSWLSIKELLSPGIQGAWNLMRETESTMRDDKEMRLFLTQTYQNLCILIFWPSQASAKACYPVCPRRLLEPFHSAVISPEDSLRPLVCWCPPPAPPAPWW